MKHVTEFAHYGFAVAGIFVSHVHPMEGSAIVAISLLCAAGARFIDRSDAKTAKEAISTLASIVNANAKRLEQAAQDIEKLSNDFAFSNNARGLGLK